MHTIETGSPVVTLTSPQMVQISDPNQDQDTIPACVKCGTTNIAEIGYDLQGSVWQCANGHRAHEVDELPVMPAYVEAALAEIAAHCWGEYDWAGDTARDEHGRAA